MKLHSPTSHLMHTTSSAQSMAPGAACCKPPASVLRAQDALPTPPQSRVESRANATTGCGRWARTQLAPGHWSTRHFKSEASRSGLSRGRVEPAIG